MIQMGCRILGQDQSCDDGSSHGGLEQRRSNRDRKDIGPRAHMDIGYISLYRPTWSYVYQESNSFNP